MQKPFPLQSWIMHREWGKGLVVRYEGDKVVVVFEAVGYKTLATAVVTERGLLERLA